MKLCEYGSRSGRPRLGGQASEQTKRFDAAPSRGDPGLGEQVPKVSRVAM